MCCVATTTTTTLLLLSTTVVAWSPTSSGWTSRTSTASLSSRSRVGVGVGVDPSSGRLFAVFTGDDDDDDDDDDDLDVGLNELQTALRDAVAAQNFPEAARLRDRLIARHRNVDVRKSWTRLGTAPWLVDRMEGLGYALPTTIQINSMESLNAMLSSSSSSSDDDEGGATMEERLSRNASSSSSSSLADRAVVVSGSTGSGKTLAFTVPALSALSETLFARQRARVRAEESVGDGLDDVLERVAIATSPGVRGQGREQINANSAPLLGAALSSLGKGDATDLRSPLILVVVPTRELGVQIAMTMYELVGGSVKRNVFDLSKIGTKANVFKYKGPKGVRIGCVLDDEEAAGGLKLQTDVAITTPKYLGKLLRDGDVVAEKLRVVVFDEADLGLERVDREDLNALFQTNPENEEGGRLGRLTYLVGASVTEALADLPRGVLPEDSTYIATATSFSPLSTATDAVDASANDDDTVTTTLRQLRLRLDPGLRHERCKARRGAGLLTLCRLLRNEIRRYNRAFREWSDLYNTTTADAANATEPDPADISDLTGPSLPPPPKRSDVPPPPARPRVVVFFGDEAAAAAATPLLRDAVWGDHRLCALLPDTGVHPLAMLENFRNNETTVMLATADSVRGLDLEGLTRVYATYVPDDPREYLHLAGRVGRIGQTSPGARATVTSVLEEDEYDRTDALAETLGFAFVDATVEDETTDKLEEWRRREAASLREEEEDDDDDDDDEDDDDSFGDIDVEDMRRFLEDAVTLLGDAEEPEIEA